jgi:hypothetical protein
MGVNNINTKKRFNARPKLPKALTATKDAIVFIGKLRLRPR